MPSNSGTFSGKITKQSSLSLTDQPNHEMNIAEVAGTQKSPDELWNNAKITYWGVTDALDGKGTQHGYFNNVHPDGGRDYGTFEAKLKTAGSGMTLEGTYKFTGGDGKYRGLKGGGKFKTAMKSENEIECSWKGSYELTKARAAGGSR